MGALPERPGVHGRCGCYALDYSSDSQKLESGPGSICVGIPSFPGFEVGGWPYSNCLASAVPCYEGQKCPNIGVCRLSVLGIVDFVGIC